MKPNTCFYALCNKCMLYQIHVFMLYVILYNNPHQNGEQVFVAANGSGCVIKFLIVQYPRVTQFNKYYFFLAHTVFV